MLIKKKQVTIQISVGIFVWQWSKDKSSMYAGIVIGDDNLFMFGEQFLNMNYNEL